MTCSPVVDLPVGELDTLLGPVVGWLTAATHLPEGHIQVLLSHWQSVHGVDACRTALLQAADVAPFNPIPYIEKVLHDTSR